MRPPEVFVRELSPEEGAWLKSISKRAKYQSKRQRAMILLASSTGMPAPQIAAVVRTDESHVRKVIHAFNDRGFDSLDPDYRGGRPKKTTPVQRDRIVSVARARPDTQGVALTRRSLPKLQAPLPGMGIILSQEALRQTLISAGLSHQRTRSWKCSPDPDFQAKAERVLGLYREFVVNNADYPDCDTLKKAMADHIQYRNGPHRDQRLLKAERRLLIAA
jgi:transposase